MIISFKKIRHFILNRIKTIILISGIFIIAIINISPNVNGVWGNRFFVKFSNGEYSNLIIYDNRFKLEGVKMEGVVQKKGSRTYVLISNEKPIATIRIFGSLGFVWIEEKKGKWGMLFRR